VYNSVGSGGDYQKVNQESACRRRLPVVTINDTVRFSELFGPATPAIEVTLTVEA